MALTWKLVIDSANASTLADFWAEALNYEVEDPSALIKQLLAAGRIEADGHHLGHLGLGRGTDLENLVHR